MSKKQTDVPADREQGKLLLAVGLLVLLGVIAFLMNFRFWDQRRFYPVSGTLTVGGQPGDRVQIHFQSDDRKVEIASGNVDADGKFTVYSGVDGNAGAMPGKYKIVLSQLSGSKLPAYRGEDAVAIPNTPPHTFPPAYLSSATSPLVVEVLPKANAFTFEIEMPAGSTDGPEPARPASADPSAGGAAGMEALLKSPMKSEQ